MNDTRHSLAEKLVTTMQTLDPSTPEYTDAWGALYSMYISFTRAVCRTYLPVHRKDHGSGHEDLAQEVWITVRVSIKSFQRRSAFSTWLFVIAKNACKNFTRRDKSKPEFVSWEYDPNLLEIPYYDNSVSLESRDLIAKSLSELSEMQKQTMDYMINGYTTKDIAKSLGITESAAKTRRDTARKAAKKAIKLIL